MMRTAKRLWPTIRLTLLMLGCAGVAAFFTVMSGNFEEFWVYAAPYPQKAEGAAVGLLIELAIRFYFWGVTFE